MSSIIGSPLSPHTMPLQLGHINLTPTDLSKAIDKWHTDTIGFDYLAYVTDPQVDVGLIIDRLLKISNNVINLAAIFQWSTGKCFFK